MQRGFTLIELIVTITIIFVICMIVSIVFTNEIAERSGANYLIKHDGNNYLVESYTKENNGACIFLAEKELRLCGEYSIQKLTGNGE